MEKLYDNKNYGQMVLSVSTEEWASISKLMFNNQHTEDFKMISQLRSDRH